MQVRHVRGQTGRGAEGAERFVRLAAGMQRVTQIGVDSGMVRVDRDGTTEELRRRSFAPTVQGDDPEQVQSVRVLRPGAQNRPGSALRLVEPARAERLPGLVDGMSKRSGPEHASVTSRAVFSLHDHLSE
jgi:hypothetical protein